MDVKERIQRNWKVLSWKVNAVNVFVVPDSSSSSPYEAGSRSNRKVAPEEEEEEEDEEGGGEKDVVVEQRGPYCMTRKDRREITALGLNGFFEKKIRLNIWLNTFLHEIQLQLKSC